MEGWAYGWQYRGRKGSVKGNGDVRRAETSGRGYRIVGRDLRASMLSSNID